MGSVKVILIRNLWILESEFNSSTYCPRVIKPMEFYGMLSINIVMILVLKSNYLGLYILSLFFYLDHETEFLFSDWRVSDSVIKSAWYLLIITKYNRWNSILR